MTAAPSGPVRSASQNLAAVLQLRLSTTAERAQPVHSALSSTPGVKRLFRVQGTHPGETILGLRRSSAGRRPGRRRASETVTLKLKLKKK